MSAVLNNQQSTSSHSTQRDTMGSSSESEEFQEPNNSSLPETYNNFDEEPNTEKDPENFVRDLVDDERNIGTSHALRRTQSNASGHSVQSQDYATRVLSQRSPAYEKKEMETPLPKMGKDKPYPPDLPDRDPWRVDFNGPDDPDFPQNWPLKRKMAICGVLGFATLCVAWGSSVFAAGSQEIMMEFGMGQVTVTLGISLYVLGFASGPVIWAPLSELYGRKIVLLVSLIGFTCFTFGTATAKDFQTIMLTRFFAGFIGASPLVVVAAAFADLFNNETRGKAMIIFSGMVFTGPILAPIVGGFIAQSYLGWRWLEYITGIMSGTAIIGLIFLYEESYAPLILCRKASELRRRTGNWGIYAPHESVELDLNQIVTNNLTRPVRLLFTEPIIFLITLYTAFIYGILYLCLESYPIIFGPEGYNFPANLIQMPYISLAVGMVIAMFLNLFVFEPMYKKALAKNNGKPVPEARLPPMIVGAIVFPIGILWLCWTGAYFDTVPWPAPAVAGLFIGYGLLSIFLPAINYIIDAYLVFAASALAANTLLRSAFGAVFPLFATQMFRNLGTQWAGLLIGLIGIVLMPVPVLFYIFGKRIRVKSKFAFDMTD